MVIPVVSINDIHQAVPQNLADVQSLSALSRGPEIMSILDIRVYPDPVLLEKAKPVEVFDHTLRKLLADMAETMYAAPGVGLAAPQVGVSIRALVADASPRVEGSALIKLVNPVITFAEGTSECEEGCLSVPGYSENVARAAKVVVEGYDEQGKPIKIETDTFLATILQHEMDHLDGILFIDHIGRLKRNLIRQKLKKQARRKEQMQERRISRL
jgi:peptide deformylase